MRIHSQCKDLKTSCTHPRLASTPYISAEPMMEPWPVSIEYQHTGLSQRLSVHSLERLNLVVTPAAFRSIGDARLFHSMMMSLSPPAPAGMPPKALDATSKASAPAKNMLSTMYRQDSQSKHVLISDFVGCGPSTCPPGMVPKANERVPGWLSILILSSILIRGSSTYSVHLRPSCTET